MGSTRYTCMLEVVHACDDFPYGPAAERYYQLFLPNDDQSHGYMLPEIVEKMPWTSQFTLHHENPRKVHILDASNGTDTANAINKAFQDLIDICVERDLFHVICGQHSELFAIAGARYDKPVWIERYAISLFGITARGAHMIAYTNTSEGMKLWIARRAANLYIFPGLLDSTVGGGVKAGVSPFQTIVDESQEEASLSENFVRKFARSRGAISHMSVTGKDFPGEKGLANPDYIYVYDIELPGDVVPRPHDEEVSNFYCMSTDEVKIALLIGEFKPDSGAVVVDFLIRHGVITPENERNFVEIEMRLHRKLPFRLG